MYVHTVNHPEGVDEDCYQQALVRDCELSPTSPPLDICQDYRYITQLLSNTLLATLAGCYITAIVIGT